MPIEQYNRTLYSIGEASQILGIKEHVLRFWEKEFDELKPKKSPKGRRVYSQKDFDIINTIRMLLYKKEFTISGAKKQLKNVNIEPFTLKEKIKTQKINHSKQKKAFITKIEKKLIISELKKIITLLNKK